MTARPSRADLPTRLERIEAAVEERIRRMAEGGELSGLPGEGSPLAGAGPDHAGERWATFHVMSNNRVLPGWAQLRRDIEGEVERLTRSCRAHREWLDGRRRALAALPAERIMDAVHATERRDAAVRRELDAALVALNAKVARSNALVPVPSLELVPFTARRFLGEGDPRA